MGLSCVLPHNARNSVDYDHLARLNNNASDEDEKVQPVQGLNEKAVDAESLRANGLRCSGQPKTVRWQQAKHAAIRL